MHHNLSTWLFGALTCLFIGVSAAENERPVRILYFKAPSGAPEKAFVYANAAMLTETELPRFNFSESILIPKGSLQLRFLPEPLEEGEKLPRTAPSVSIAAGWSKVLLLVFQDKENETMPIRVKAIDASDGVFGPGSVYAINFSKIRVGGMVGDKRLDLRPKAVKIIKDPISKNGYYPTRLYSIVKEGDKPQRFIKQMWERSDTTRQVLFILPKPAPQHATYYSAPIRDF